jgi:HK97 family phage portal protein
MGLMDWLVRRPMRAYMQVMGGGLAGDFRQEAYRNAVVRETIDAIARHAAKISAIHMRNGVRVDDELQYVIGTRPNPWMSAYDFQYKLVAQALEKNNAFALPVFRRNGTLEYLIPVEYTTCEALESENGRTLYMRFQLKNGKETMLPRSELIHLRRHFNRSVVLGDDNTPLESAVEMVNVANAGMMSAVKSGTSLRGIVKLKKIGVKERDVKDRVNEFIDAYLNPENTGGIAGMDGEMDFVQLDPSRMYSLTTEQMSEIRKNVYRYYGVNEKFITGTYTEDEWNATYEGVIEPIPIQLHMEYNNALLTIGERKGGHVIKFEADRLQYASTRTKVELGNRLGMLGALTYDELRGIFNMPPLPNGEGKKMIPPWNSEGEAALLKAQQKGVEGNA